MVTTPVESPWAQLSVECEELISFLAVAVIDKVLLTLISPALVFTPVAIAVIVAADSPIC